MGFETTNIQAARVVEGTEWNYHLAKYMDTLHTLFAEIELGESGMYIFKTCYLSIWWKGETRVEISWKQMVRNNK